jgi:hypothetical protein
VELLKIAGILENLKFLEFIEKNIVSHEYYSKNCYLWVKMINDNQKENEFLSGFEPTRQIIF